MELEQVVNILENTGLHTNLIYDVASKPVLVIGEEIKYIDNTPWVTKNLISIGYGFKGRNVWVTRLSVTFLYSSFNLDDALENVLCFYQFQNLLSKKQLSFESDIVMRLYNLGFLCILCNDGDIIARNRKDNVYDDDPLTFLTRNIDKSQEVILQILEDGFLIKKPNEKAIIAPSLQYFRQNRVW